MRVAKFLLAAVILSNATKTVGRTPGDGRISGKVSFTGTPAKPKVVDMSKEPACAKLHVDPLLTEDLVVGDGGGIRNVLVYVSSGLVDTSAAPAAPALFDQQGCNYTTHVLAFRIGQEVKISNSDPFSHNIHPLAKINREWNRIQPPGTPAFSYAYDKEEIITVKCNIHPWMHGYFAVMKNGNFAVTREDGKFELPALPPGKYTVTAWQETLGAQSREITVAPGEMVTLNFTFGSKP